MARASRRPSHTRTPVVLVFGENTNDARAISRLIEALCPELKGRVKARPEPASLQRSASSDTVMAWMDRIADVVRNNERPVRCVFIHRDSDMHDPFGRLQTETEAALRNAGVADAHAVVPVHEIEAWWLLFPDATEQVRASWAGKLDRSHADRDRHPNPKEELTRRTRRTDQRHAYSPADSPRVAQHVAAAIEHGVLPTGQSRTYQRFGSSVSQCCANVASR